MISYCNTCGSIYYKFYLNQQTEAAKEAGETSRLSSLSGDSQDDQGETVFRRHDPNCAGTLQYVLFSSGGQNRKIQGIIHDCDLRFINLSLKIISRLLLVSFNAKWTS